jgi:hypothetical protein
MLFMHNAVFRSFSLLLIVSLMSCVMTRSRPDWISGELPEAFSEAKFLTAIGTGDRFESAQIAAKSELSRIFSSEVQSEIELIDQESSIDGQSTTSSRLLVNTRISTGVELQGVEIPLHWSDPKTGEVWALAVLDRNKECLRIRAEGRDLITRQAAMSVDAGGQQNALVAIRVLLHLVEISEELDVLQAHSRVLGTQCLTSRVESTGRFRAQLDRALRELSFVVTAREFDSRTGASIGPLPQLRERIAENLTRMGFQVGPARDAQVIAVKARLRLNRVRRGTEWIEYRWEGSAEIASFGSGGSAIISAASEGAESHPEDSTARLRARRKGELDLSRQLDQRLKDFLADG